MRELPDLDRFPLDRPGSDLGKELLSRCRCELGRHGMFNLPELVRPEALRRCVDEVAPILERPDRTSFERLRTEQVGTRARPYGARCARPSVFLRTPRSELTRRGARTPARAQRRSRMLGLHPRGDRAMSLATVLSRASLGITAPPVQVEVHITGGLPKFAIVGLPEATVRESKDRVAQRDHQLQVRISQASDHRQPRSGRASEGRKPVRPPDRDRDPRSDRTALPRPASRARAHRRARPDGGLRRTGGSLPAALRVRDAKRILVIPADDAHEAELATGARLFPHVVSVKCTRSSSATVRRPRPPVHPWPAPPRRRT